MQQPVEQVRQCNKTYLAVVRDGSQKVGFITEVGLSTVPGYHRVILYLEEVSSSTAGPTAGRSYYCVNSGGEELLKGHCV